MPPTVQKQTPRPMPNGQPVRQGSLLSSAIDVGELVNDFLKITCYGVNRVGKTTWACHFPKPLLLISFEPNKTGGALSVKNVPGVKLLRITQYDDALRLADELKGNRTYKTHVLDGATSLQDLALLKLKGGTTLPEQLNFGTVSQDHYRDRSEMTKTALRPFLNLDAHTIVLAKEKDHNPPKEERNKIVRGLQTGSYLSAEVGGATAGWLFDTCDCFVRMFLDGEVKEVERKTSMHGKTVVKREMVETGRTIHRLRTKQHVNFAAGLRSEMTGPVPEFVDGETPQELYDNLMAVIRGE